MDAPASHRLIGSPVPAGGEQKAFDWEPVARTAQTQKELHAVFMAMVRIAGGAEWLTNALNREPSYLARISDAMNEREQRPVQYPWIAPLLDDTAAADVFLNWLCEHCGYEPPVKQKRDIPEEAVNAAAREIIAEMKDDEQRELMRARIAKRLGVRPEDVRL